MIATDLRYLDPERAAIVGEDCANMTVRGATGDALGRLHGFVVDVAARRLRYLVVRTLGVFGSTKMLPFGSARVDLDSHAIELLDRSDLRRTVAFSPADYPRISEDDWEL